jgi:hypothetical protein
MELTYVSATCSGCGTVDKVAVDSADWERFIGGELVQRVWPHKTDDEREVLIGARSGLYYCPICWDDLFAEENFE